MMVSTLDGRVETGEGGFSPLPPSPLTKWLPQIASIGCLILMAILLYYVMTNIHLLTTDPCTVCETKNAMTTCMKLPLTRIGGN